MKPKKPQKIINYLEQRIESLENKLKKKTEITKNLLAKIAWNTHSRKANKRKVIDLKADVAILINHIKYIQQSKSLREANKRCETILKNFPSKKFRG